MRRAAALLLLAGALARAGAAGADVPADAAVGAGAGAGAPETDAAFVPIIVEGDILTAPPTSRRAIGSSRLDRRWPHGEIPYRVDGALGERGARAVDVAVARWNRVSGITLRAVPDGVAPPRDHLLFQAGDGCASWVGRQGGAQPVWIGPDCTGGSVMHEIGHALGLEHEHTRPDRDAHVRVNWERILPEKRHNFALAPADSRLLGPYDLDSIMHYGAYNFSLDGGATLEPIDPAAGTRMGQREAPSEGDIAAVARLYASDLALDVQFDDERAAREVTLFVTSEHTQGAHALVLILEAPGLDAVAESPDGWRCAFTEARASCALDRLDGEGRSQVVFSLGAPVDAARIAASLSSKTPDVDPDDNGERLDGEPASGAARPASFLGALADESDPDGVPSDKGAPLAGGAGGASWPLLLGAACAGGWRRRRVRPGPPWAVAGRY